MSTDGIFPASDAALVGVSNDRLESLKRSRATKKSKITRLANWIGTIEGPDDTSLQEVQFRLDALTSAYQDFDSIQDQIDDISADLSDSDAQRSAVENQYFHLKSIYSHLLELFNTNTQAPVISPPSSENENLASGSNQNSSSPHQPTVLPPTPLPILPEVRLPPVSLPTFSGDPHDFPAFSELFKALVDDNQQISKTTRFFYLRSSLTGRAAEVIRNIQSTGSNYDLAWRLLRDRFHSDGTTVDRLNNELLNLEAITSENPVQLRNLLDNSSRILRSLLAFETYVEGKDSIYASIICSKLDPNTKKQFKLHLQDCSKIVTFSDLYSFLDRRLKALESLMPSFNKRDSKHPHKINSLHEANYSNEPSANKNYDRFNNNTFKNAAQYSNFKRKPFFNQKRETTDNINKNWGCLFCSNPSHKTNQCPKYMGMSITDRKNYLIKNNHCLNCLSKKHHKRFCTSLYKCRFCDLLHHSSLCPTSPYNNQDPTHQESSLSTPSNDIQTSQTTSSVNLPSNTTHLPNVLLSTASILIIDSQGAYRTAIALLDSGSQMSFVSKELADKLRLPSITSQLNICGVGGSKKTANYRISARIKSRVSNYFENLELFVLPTISMPLPQNEIDVSGWDIPAGIRLANDNFNIPSKIDILLGAQTFFQTLYKGRLPATPHRPSLVHTKWGWIVGGAIPHSTTARYTASYLTLSEQVERLWKLDEPSVVSQLTPEEITCEQHFLKTHSRLPNGRFIVQLPFSKDPSSLGTSRVQARRRWISVEQRLSKNNELNEGYTSFMKNYLELGHMSYLGPENKFLENSTYCFLPHHPVFKLESSSTRLRVVYDGSLPTSNGVSLNSILMTGPRTQDDLFDILLRFRLHKFVFSADVCKMFRQVLISEQDRKYQLIFWRATPAEPLNIYTLNTATYGTSPAPFLATRCLNQLAIDEKEKYPLASNAIRDFYVDDILSGHDDINHAIKLQNEMISMLAAGGFSLSKFAANSPLLLQNIPFKDREPILSLDILSADVVKALGLFWLPSEDTFTYNASKIFKKSARTKRDVLSQLASLFDPLGLLSPIICQAKIFMRNLWREKLGWDDTLPPDLRNQWEFFRNSLSQLHKLRIPRHASGQPAIITYEIHAFCDASEVAYGAAVYLRTINSNNDISIHLLTAKSRVSPQKQLSIPRLELSAALLASRLLTTVIKALDLSNLTVYGWSDSQIVLAWITAPSYQWKNFVANRVAEIQNLKATWHYVPSGQNPADLLSRGSTVTQLQNSSLWWTGPEFLRQLNYSCARPDLDSPIPDIPERKQKKIISANSVDNTCNLISRFSSLTTLINTTAWIFRFNHNSQKNAIRQSGPLTVLERDNALSKLILRAQFNEFSAELSSLAIKGELSKKSKLNQLSPFIDEQGLLRVGGRLKNTSLSHSKKHPIILPRTHPLTILIIRQAHLRSLHGGPQLVLTTLQQKYWIVNGRNVIRKLIHSCIPCFKLRPVNSVPKMGQLPSIRTEALRAFYHTGVDFAGPFLLRPPTRSAIKLKYHVAVFVCMSTRAIHLELVGSLSTDNFIAALNRFTSRRGLCKSLSCDNATNFIGARNQLKEIYAFLKQNSDSIAHHLANIDIQWKFIPPMAPHFGGLWESAVKSMKHHLKRTAGLALLTYEEFLTMLCSIEACLNSRPLTALSTDPSDYRALTPGHFLIGTSLLSPPALDHTEQHISRLTRWQRIQAITQHFWRRWSLEYISSLQPCSKWTSSSTPLAIGQLVLIKEDHLPPLHWRLGRILETHPGSDNIIRVLSVKTASGIVKRSAHKLFPLPVSDQ